MEETLIIYIDVDDTIAKSPKAGENTIEDFNYKKATPIKPNIKKANQLYENGHRIIYWTGRGGETEKDWRDITKKQLEKWGCKYHELKCGVYKPWDLIIDDKVLNTKNWENEIIKDL